MSDDSAPGEQSGQTDGFDPNQGWVRAAAEIPRFRGVLWRHRLSKLFGVLRLYPQRVPRLARDHRRLARSAGSLEVSCSLGRLRLDNPNSLSQLREILFGGAYAAPGFVPRSGWLVVDAGANLGFFSAWAMSFMRRGSLIAIEAVPATYSVMHENVISARGRDVIRETVNVAVTDRARTLEFAVPSGYSNFARATRHLGRMGPAEGVPRVQLPGDSLDAIVARSNVARGHHQVDLLKLDVEGSEADCLRGATDVLPRTQRVVFEYHSRELLSECADILTAAGFRQRCLRFSLLSDAVGNSFWSR